MPRVSDAKEKLTDAALALIWESSYGATSVDDICERAQVKKGSFYHFFKSKSDLEIAALEANWQLNRQRWNDQFSPDRAPLERFEAYFAYVLEKQIALRDECGSVLGCPLCSVGTEVGRQEEGIREKAMEIIERYIRYFESAIRDAHAQGLVVAPDAAAKARVLFAFVQGAMTQARLANSVEPLRDLKTGAWALLGVRQAEPAGV